MTNRLFVRPVESGVPGVLRASDSIYAAYALTYKPKGSSQALHGLKHCIQRGAHKHSMASSTACGPRTLQVVLHGLKLRLHGFNLALRSLKLGLQGFDLALDAAGKYY